MPDPFGRLAAAVLLQGVLDAHEGRPGAAYWLQSEQAHEWAELLGLPCWPPSPEQLASKQELKHRASLLNVDDAPMPALFSVGYEREKKRKGQRELALVG